MVRKPIRGLGSAFAVVLLAGSLIAGCGSGPVASSAPPTAVVTPAPTASRPAASPSAQPSRTPSPAPPAFVTPTPPAAGATWTGIEWQKLAAGDGLALVTSMIRWRGGFVAVGAVVASGDTSRTPVWTSADGESWRAVDPSAFGPTDMVVGLGETDAGVVALTLRGGANQCDGETRLGCWTLSGPLRSWTSADGVAWTEHGGPDVKLTPDCDGCGLDVPIVRAGRPGVIVVVSSMDGQQVAVSPDGSTWETVPGEPFPSRSEIRDVAAFGSGFVAVGELNGDPTRAIALWSGDGRTWESRPIKAIGLAPKAGSTASHLVAGSAGLIAQGSDDLAPGTEYWWSSLDGRTWKQLSNYPPLGTWFGEGEGSGMIPNGNLLADGERLLAYRGGAKTAAWTSTDGRAWQKLDLSGAGPTTTGDWPMQDVLLLPIGLLWIADDGTTWFGRPMTS